MDVLYCMSVFVQDEPATKGHLIKIESGIEGIRSRTQSQDLLTLVMVDGACH